MRKPQLQLPANYNSRFQKVMAYWTWYRNTWMLQENHENIRLNILLWLILFTANIVDLIVTYHAFSLGAIEANPAMYVIAKHFGDIGIAYFKGLMLGALFILLPFIKKGLQKFLIFTCVVYVILVISHVVRF